MCSLQLVADAVQLFEGRITDLDISARLSMRNGHFQPERIGQGLLERDRIRILLDHAVRSRLGGLADAHGLLRKRFRLSHGQAFINDAAGEKVRVDCGHERSRVAGRQGTIGHHLANMLRKLQQSQCVGNMAATFADHLSEVCLRVIMLVDQLLITKRLFHGIQISALDILDNGEFQRDPIAHIANHDRHVDQVRSSLNPRLTIQGIVMTMFDGRNNLANQVVQDVRTHMGDKVYETVIPRNVRVSEAPSYGKPAILYDLKCSGSQAYLQLASEVIRRERLLRAA